eukprot:13701653-Alexandrium_andersonii.AAC.1
MTSIAIAEATAQRAGCPRSRNRGAAQSMSDERPFATQSSAIAMPWRSAAETPSSASPGGRQAQEHPDARVRQARTRIARPHTPQRAG